MGSFSEFEGQLDATGMRFAIVAGRFNDTVTKPLLEGARSALVAHGTDFETVPVVWVPGAFEVPLVAKRLASSGTYDAVICLGAVVRGGTPHFEYVAGQCAAGVMRAGLDANVPVLFGVLTTDNLDQALQRAGSGAGNKGFEAAISAIEMVDVLRRLP